MKQSDNYGLEFGPGDSHYRAFVGPPEDYDLIAGQTFGLLLAAGLRETHRLLDLGCGSLRVGRLLIPYLRSGHYHGIEPNRWLVDEGIENELGRDLVRIKRPSFRYVEDFSAAGFGVSFDFIVAQSIFSHTFHDLAVRGFHEMANALSGEGVLLATFVHSDDSTPAVVRGDDGTGWLYPGCVSYDLPGVRDMLLDAGLVSRPLSWVHPRQRWVVAGHDPASVARVESSVRSLNRPIMG